VVHSFQNGLKESAGRAHPGMLIKYGGLRLDSGDEEEHGLFNHISSKSGKLNVNQVCAQSVEDWELLGHPLKLWYEY
jgi:hypothetical protein